ncbi:NUDIX hydrolase [Rariglobus hedericola]|uniref:GDP-mannose pyrophosphatase n=1 Tax=Rariglobus hedericola TaxID=2597822 RepID=A0A556QRW7_9BACT|nr:NUDIX hydrolase [Rariglobus hedericola]TSJ79385.1 NUDIX hydrolase [Rariglobus hedericola]
MNHSSGSPSRWEKGASRSLAATRIFDVRGVEFRHPVRGTQREFVVIDAPDWVNVLALTPDGHLVFVNQFRYGTNDFSWEIPGGVIDKGEDPVVAGVRELQEETGYVGKSSRLLGSVNPNPAILNNRCHLVLVEGCVRTTEQEWDADEEIEVTTLPVDEAYAWARSGRITHSLVLNALLLFAPVWAEMKAGR